jgi:aminoglycoside phosphotransferase (APT) family kinase protein
VDPFLEKMEDLMARQPSKLPAPLSSAELRELGAHIKRICYRLEELEIPNSLGHCDLNPGNILSRDDHKTVFLDWAEAYVGQPFPTFEYLRLTFRKLFPASAWSQAHLEDSYLNPWGASTSPDCIRDALNLTPVLAALYAALAGDRWQDPEQIGDSNVAKWLRSLTRRIQREVQKCATSGAKCAIS